MYKYAYVYIDIYIHIYSYSLHTKFIHFKLFKRLLL
jgi:hypothetical protein